MSKIIKLESENVKRLKAISITPDGNIVEITGKNGMGKSSILDSIYWALGGSKDIQSQPIRKGEKKASSVIHLDDGRTVKRTYSLKEDGTYSSTLILENEEGARFQKPVEILKEMVGDLTFDPLEFTRMGEKKQFDHLRQFVLGFDFDTEAVKRKDAFSRRTDVNRRAKELRAQADGIVVGDDVPEEEIDISALTDEMQKIGEDNLAIERRKSNREAVANEADRFDIEATRLDGVASELRRQAQDAEDQAKQKRDAAAENRRRLEEAGPLPDPKDAAEIRVKIEEARIVNSAVARKKARKALVDQAIAAEADATKLTKEIEDSDARKMEAVSKAKMPVEGITFGEESILLNGVPFEQASTADQLRTSVALTMAANPKLKIILIREGSLLDRDSMKILADMAEANDYQVWIESVESSRPSAIIIEDGMIVGADVTEMGK